MMTRIASAKDLYEAQSAREALVGGHDEAAPYDRLSERDQRKYHAAAVHGRGARLQPWHGDHTDLAQALSASGVEAPDLDVVASNLLGSVWLDAVRAHAQVAILEALSQRLGPDEQAQAEIATITSILLGHTTGSES